MRFSVTILSLLAACSLSFGQGIKYEKVMILGNSITHHGPSKAVDWAGNWGMAASSIDKDFAHLLKDKFTEANDGKAPEMLIRNVSTFERTHATMNIAKDWKPFFDFKPTVLILAIGENVPNPQTPEAQEAFLKALKTALDLFKENGNPKLFVRSSFWPHQVKDKIMQEACDYYGGTFVNIGALAKDEKNYARSEREYKHAGVAGHPGDQGMAEIARLIWEAVEKN